MSLKSFFSYFVFVLIFLSFFSVFLISPSIAADQIDSNASNILSPTPAQTEAVTGQNIWTQFWNWLFGLFTKTDYIIGSSKTQNDMNEYGDKDKTEELKKKRSFAGSRSTDFQSQNCLKGSVIKKVILNTTGYPNSDLSYICVNSNQCSVSTDSTCKPITIKDLAHYFVQINKNFYCASDKNELVDIETAVISNVDQFSSTDIPETEISCYQQIYDDLYLTPKETTDNNEENTKKMIKTSIPSNSQQNLSGEELKTQLDKIFTPSGSQNSAGLYGLIPEKWKQSP